MALQRETPMSNANERSPVPPSVGSDDAEMVADGARAMQVGLAVSIALVAGLLLAWKFGPDHKGPLPPTVKGAPQGLQDPRGNWTNQ